MATMPTAKQRIRLQQLSLKLFGVSSRWQKILETSKLPDTELDPNADQSGDQPVLRQIWRRPTIDEVLNALEQNAQVYDLSNLEQGELLEVLAAKFNDNTLGVKLCVQIGDDEQADFDEMLLLIPEPQRPAVQALVVKQPIPGAFCVRGLDFLGELAYLAQPHLRDPENAE